MSTHRKEDFWIGAKGGLVEWKHYKRMGNAVWLFLHLLRCQTALSTLGEGVVYYGHPMTLDSVRRETRGIPVRTLKAWVMRLRRQGYIRTEDHGCRGLVFWITNAKHKTKKAIIHRVATPIPRKSSFGFVHVSVPSETGTEHKTVAIAARVGQNSVLIETPARPYSDESATIAADSVPAIPKGFTPTNLSDHNKAAAAQSAASPTALLGNIKGKDEPRARASNPDFVKWQEKKAATDPPLIEWKRQHGL